MWCAAMNGPKLRFHRWLTPNKGAFSVGPDTIGHTHAMRWRVSHDTVGYGHPYQGRYMSFPVQPGPSLLKVCRYVERNPLTTDLVQ